MLIIVLYNDMRSNYDIKHIMICLPYNYPKIYICISCKKKYYLQLGNLVEELIDFNN